MAKRVEIPGFPDYEIDEDGTVYSIRSGARRLPSTTKNGLLKITLYREGVPYTKSLALLVAKAHLYNDHDPEVFDTPIHLDNNQKNNHVDNLAWRPRWFALQYQLQYWKPEYRHARVAVIDVDTERVYDSLVAVCQAHGFLYHDVIKSCTQGTYVFPSWKVFSFVN